MKKILTVLAGIAVVYCLISTGLFAAMSQPPESFARVMAKVPWPAFVVLPFKPLWYVARVGQLRIGDPAPDFLLDSADHQDRFQLSSLKGERPVVLVFGSYT
jgi:hypothetical protein